MKSFKEHVACCDECYDHIVEASEYQGKKVTLNDPKRSSDGKKKFYVYVKNEKGNVIKLGFGDPNMEIKRDDPARRKSFRARHNCDDPGPKWKARYWSCYQWRAGAKVDEEMDPRDHVKKKDDQYVIVAPSGKIVKTFDDKKDAEDWVIKNHDAVMKEVRQDPDIKDKEGTQPAKYHKGLSKSTKQKRDAHFKAKKSGPAPGDADAETKPSVHTKKYKQMFGEEIAGLKKKSEKSGISYGILKKVYDRGMAAYKTGHRPGTTPQQWAMARVNSFVTKGKGTWGGADKDLAAKARG
tara:strand:+ start:1442 stop:2326 length:885 start_codon:yes stop_codon:yes gene_type:complete